MNMDHIQRIREESPTMAKRTFLNHAARGPLHGKTVEAIQHYTKCWGEFDFEESDQKKKDSRVQFGKLINASEEEILFTPDVTAGSRLAANLINYEKDSNIVCYWNDYVAQVYQALFLKKTKGIEYRPVPDRKNKVLPEEFAQKVDNNTKLVLLSHVQWLSGFKADVKEIAKIAHENDALIVIDSIQSSGAMVNDVKNWGVDFLTCGTAKWLLGPNQAGWFYMKKKLIKEFDPPFASYQGVELDNYDEIYWNVNNMVYMENIFKYMDVNPSDFLYAVASGGMSIILEFGIKNVQKRILQLTDYLINELQKLGDFEFVTPLEREYRSGVVNVRVPKNVEIAKKLKEDNIIVSSRYGGLRISPHFYNNEEDIDKLITGLKKHLA